MWAMVSGTVIDVLLGSGALEVSNVILQGASEVNQQQQFDPTTQAAGGFFLTLIVGAIMIAAMPDYVDAIIEDILEEPFANFAWGILALIGFFVVIVILAITVVGLIFALPLAFVFVIVGIAGSVLAYLAVCDGLVDSRWVALVVAAIATAVVNLVPVIGGVIGFVISSIGLGAVVRRWRS